MAEEMDLESMKRKDLQELCKKHGIPANSTNSAMIESLETLFQSQKLVKRKGCLKGSSGGRGEGLGLGDSKKVTFVVEEENEEVGDLRFGGKRGRKNSQGRSTVRGISGSNSAKRVPCAPARSTRSRGLAESVLWSPVIEKKKKVENSIETENLDNVKPQGRSLRSRVVVVEGSEGSTEKFERVAKIEGRRKRSRDSNVEEVGQKKSKKQAKDGEVVAEITRRSTRSSSDGEVAEKEKPLQQRQASETVIEPPRRATRRSSNLLEEPKHEPAKQAKTRVNKVVTEPVRRLMRSSANLEEDEAIVPAAGKFGNIGEAVRKGKSPKQTKEHVPEQGNSADFVSDREAVVAPTKRSTRSSSKLLGDESAPLAAGKPQKQAKRHVSRRVDSVVSVSVSEAVTRPVKRSTRSPSNLAVVKAQKQAEKRVSGKGGSSVSVSDSETVISPMRRSTRGSSNLLEGENSLNDDYDAVRKENSGKQAKKGSASKASLLEGGASSRKRGKPEVDSAIRKKGMSSKKADNRASSRGASKAIVPYSEALGRSSRLKLRKSVVDNKAVRKKKRVERRNVRVVAQATRRSTRSSPMRDDVGETLPKGKSQKQARSRFVSKGALRSSLPISEGARVFGGEKSQKAARDGEVLRRSRRNASADSESKQEVSLLMGGTSEDEAKNVKRKKTQKQYGEQDLKEESEASVFDSKTGTDTKASEVSEKFVGIQTTHSSSKQGESHNLSVGVTACDEVFETISKKNRTPASALEAVSFEERGTNVQSSAPGIQNVCSRYSPQKCLQNISTEIEVVGGDFSSYPAMGLFEDNSDVANLEVRISGKQISRIKQPTQMQESKDDMEMTSSENFEMVDLNIAGGDKAEASELHEVEVVNISETVTFPSSGCDPSVDPSVALELVGARSELNNTIDMDVSKVKPSAAPAKMHEIGESTLVEGADCMKQSAQVQEWNDDKSMTSGVNHEAEDHNTIGGNGVEASMSQEVMNIYENVMFADPCGATPTVDFSVATNGAETEVIDVNEGNVFELQRSPRPIELTEIVGSGETKEPSEKLEEYDLLVTSSGNRELKDHNVIASDQAGLAETIVEIEVVDVNENTFSEVRQSPACIRLQELENATLVEGAHEASRLDLGMDSHSCEFPICSDKNMELTSLIEDSNTGEVFKLPTMSHSKTESFEANPDVEHDKLPKEAPTGINDSQLIETAIEEVRETCQSPILALANDDSEKAEPGVLPSSPSKHPSSAQCSGEEIIDHGISQPGLDCAPVGVSIESCTSSKKAQLFGADEAEVKAETCLTPNLSFSEDDGVGTVGNRNAGEMTEYGLNPVDMQSAAYSVIMEGSEDFTNVFACEGDNNKLSETRNIPGLSLSDNCDPEFVSDVTGASHVPHRVIISDHSDAYDIPLQPADDKEATNDSYSPACIPEDNQVRMHSPDQQRNPISLCCDAASLDINPDSPSAAYKVLQQLTAEPADECVDVKLDINVRLADDVVEEMESIIPLKGETNDLCEDFSAQEEHDSSVADKFVGVVSEQSDASVLQAPHEISGEPQATDFSTHEIETADCQENMDEKNTKRTTSRGKSPKGDVSTEDAIGSMNDDDISVDKFDKIREQDDASTLTPLRMVAFETAEASSSTPFETPAYQGTLDDGGEDVDHADNCKDVEQGETALCSTSVVASSALEEAELHLHHKVNISVYDMAQDDTVTGILEDEKVPSSCGQSLASLQEQRREDIEEGSAKEVKNASPEQINADIKEVSAVDDEKVSLPSGPSIVGPKEQSMTDNLEVSASVANDQLDKAVLVKENTTALVVQSNYNTHEDASSAHDECFGGEFDRLQQDPLVSRSPQPDAEEAYIASSRPLMYMEEFFPMDTDVANNVNDSGQVGQWGERIEDFDYSKGENYLEVNSMKEQGERDKMEMCFPVNSMKEQGERDKMEMCFPGSSGVESEDAFFLGSGAFTDHEKISASSPIQEEKNVGQETSALKKDEGRNSKFR